MRGLAGLGEAPEVFRSDSDLERYLRNTRGWNRDRDKKFPEWLYTKQFGGVWFEISGHSYGFNNDVGIGPTIGATPRWGYEGYDQYYPAFREATHTYLDVQGLSYADVEAVITTRLLPAYKEFAAPFEQQRREEGRELRATTTWGEYEGKAAITAWRARVEELLLEFFTGSAEHFRVMQEQGEEYGYSPKRPFFTTANLFVQFVADDTGGHEISWPSGYGARWAKRNFKGVLDSLEKRGLIYGGAEWGERGSWTFNERALLPA
jgi:hypothetical protein